MRIITHKDWLVIPWKNGGGQTTQLAVFPEKADFESFMWRLSMAAAREDGPFSRFEGIDRTLLILEGQGVILHRPSKADITLNAHTEPFVFAGEEPVTMTLVDGPILDFNVMTRRTRCRHSVSSLRPTTVLTVPAENAVRVLFCRNGSATVGNTSLRAREAILLEPGESLPTLIPDGALELLLVRIMAVE